MTLIRILPFALLAVPASALVAAPTVRDFELPPGPTASPTATPQVQGPVDPEAPVTTRPRPAPAPDSTPAAAPTPQVTTPASAPSPRDAAPITRPSAPTERTAPAQPEPATPGGTLPEAVSSASPASSEDLAAPSAPSVQAAPSVPVQESMPWWPWAAGALALLGGLIGLALWRRRKTAPFAAPQIELLLVTPEGEEPRAPSPAVADTPPLRSAPAGAASPLRIEATPTHLTRSLMTASFACRVSLVNRGDTALDDITIGLDLTTAHSNVPTSEQLADPARTLPEAERIARIAPGESIEFAHEVRLPTSEIRTLRQGAAHLYVPLLRVRAEAAGSAPVARTFIVGTLPEAGAQKLQPFRLDEMPQTYRAIGLAALD